MAGGRGAAPAAGEMFLCQSGTFRTNSVRPITYTPNTEWIDMFWEQLTDVKAGKRDINEFISSIKPEMQASLDKAWANATRCWCPSSWRGLPQRRTRWGTR